MGTADFDAAMVYWPNSKQNLSGTNVLYTEGFATANHKAILAAVGDGSVFVSKQKYDTVELYFENEAKSSAHC
jgi:hypothetical protein